MAGEADGEMHLHARSYRIISLSAKINEAEGSHPAGVNAMRGVTGYRWGHVDYALPGYSRKPRSHNEVSGVIIFLQLRGGIVFSALLFLSGDDFVRNHHHLGSFQSIRPV